MMQRHGATLRRGRRATRATMPEQRSFYCAGWGKIGLEQYKKRGRDSTVYSDYHASGGFLSHHLARISMAAVYWDAQHIDEGVRFLKQHAQPHA